MKKIIYALVIIVLISSTHTLAASELEVEIVTEATNISGHDEILGTSLSPDFIEIWHSSGGYWL